MMPASTVPCTPPQADRGALSRGAGIDSSKIKLVILRTLFALFALVFVSLAVAIPRGRRVTVTFNYDFNLSHACSLTLTKNCVKQFNVYDETDKKHEKLFSIPVPVDAAGLVRGITGTSPPLSLRAGEHIVAVTAQDADGTESDSGACTIRIQIKPQEDSATLLNQMWIL
jgi:hypothetical protein